MQASATNQSIANFAAAAAVAAAMGAQRGGAPGTAATPPPGPVPHEGTQHAVPARGTLPVQASPHLMGDLMRSMLMQQVAAPPAWQVPGQCDAAASIGLPPMTAANVRQVGELINSLPVTERTMY